MRLIDADALLNEFNTNSDVLIDNIAVRIRIVKQSTAYDIDKVVEELEERKHEICLSDDDLEYYQNGIDEAIEIVKHGCASDDVCERKYINDFELVSENHESKCIEGYDYKYCP